MIYKVFQMSPVQYSEDNLSYIKTLYKTIMDQDEFAIISLITVLISDIFRSFMKSFCGKLFYS